MGPRLRPDYLQLSELAAGFPAVPRWHSPPHRRTPATAQEISDAAGLEGGTGCSPPVFDGPTSRYLLRKQGDDASPAARVPRATYAVEAGTSYARSRQPGGFRFATELLGGRHGAVAYHAGLEAGQRAARSIAFPREAGVVVVATIAFGNGIDKPDVRFVPTSTCPRVWRAFYQETGRRRPRRTASSGLDGCMRAATLPQCAASSTTPARARPEIAASTGKASKR